MYGKKEFRRAGVIALAAEARVTIMISLEHKFFIMKTSDVVKYLSIEEQATLTKFARKVAEGRLSEGKPPFNRYLCCNAEEPYAAEVLRVVFEGESLKSGDPMVLTGVEIRQMLEAFIHAKN
jgi:hypothetical protein